MSASIQQLGVAFQIVKAGLKTFDEVVERTNKTNRASLSERHTPEEVEEAMAVFGQMNEQARAKLIAELWTKGLEWACDEPADEKESAE